MLTKLKIAKQSLYIDNVSFKVLKICISIPVPRANHCWSLEKVEAGRFTEVSDTGVTLASDIFTTAKSGNALIM